MPATDKATASWLKWRHRQFKPVKGAFSLAAALGGSLEDIAVIHLIAMTSGTSG